MGRLIVQIPGKPGQILAAFHDMVGAGPTQIRWAVAYATLGGCKALIDQLESDFGIATWKAIQKEIVVSLDYGITEPQALRFLAAQDNCSVYIANPGVVTAPGFR